MKITDVIDKSKLGDTEFDNLLFLWYDEENDNFVELDTILDEENSTVSVETTHFSKYMIVDGKEWYRAWQDIYTKINESKGQHIPNATVLISKSSNIYNVDNANRNELIVSNIVDSMSDSDIMSFLTYQNAGGMNTDFTSVKSALKWDPIYYSRTANASYGIGLAAVILNDEAMGYNSKIIFITDSSVSVDSRFLKLAINNKIPIYFFCIGDFNTAALIGYAQLTGGKVYSAKTAAEINQSCNEIGPKTFVGETDTDGDGFTDIEEMSGLIVSSNCKIVNTDYMKADTDDDGLDDNEEVDVELTKVEIPGKQGNTAIVKYYHHMWSDPSLEDTDGDFDLDSIDPSPKYYQLNGVLIENIDKLNYLACDYVDENNLSSEDYETNVETWLVFMFIRQFNKNYVNNNWDGTGNIIDEDFVDYVYVNANTLYNYFEQTSYFYANASGEVGDLYHMAATATGYIFKSNFDFGIKFGVMPEYHIDNLSGWAGDLQTAMNNAMLITDKSKDYDEFKTTMLNLIGYDSSINDLYEDTEYEHSFDIDDVYADTDAYNIYGMVCNGQSLKEACLSYYDTGYLKRFSLFTNNWDEEEISDVTYTYTKNKYLGIVQWPLFDYDFNDVQSKAARDAFVEFLMWRISNE